MRCFAITVALLAFAAAGCATLDNSSDRERLSEHTHTRARSAAGLLRGGATTRALPAVGPDSARAPAHGPASRGPDGWVVTVTPRELAALGLGQQMELDVQAPDVVYVVDYQRLGQLDSVFARTAGGLLPLRALLTEKHDAGRVVLRSRKTPPPASQPTPADACET